MTHWSQLTKSETPRVAIIAGSLANSLLPDIMTAGMKGRGMAVPLEVAAEEFDACVAHLKDLGFLGASVAHPHKAQAARMAARFFTVRTAMGVANALRFDSENIYGLNTEAPAIQSLLGISEPGTALVMGAGSGARSVCAALLEQEWKVKVWARNGMRARMLQTTFGRYGKLDLLPHPQPMGCNLVVNCTLLGSRAGEKPPIDWNFAKRGVTCMDLVYRRVPTEFLREATNRGFRSVDGKEIVVEKAALSIEWWLGTSVDRTDMLRAAGLKLSSEG